jgi:ATP-dependent DNA helicase RecG
VTANEVDQALAAPAAEVGRLLLRIPEDQWFDRKSVLIAPKDLAPALVAFANAEGGTVVVGLSNGTVQGVGTRAAKVNDLRQVPIDFTSPAVRARFGQIACVNDAGEPDKLLVIRIDPGERVHEVQNGDCYLRIGDETRRLNYQHRQELEFDKGQSQYDGYPAAGLTFDSLDTWLVENYRSKTGAKGNARGVFEARSLLTPKGELTNAAVLLFGRNPSMLFPQAYVRVIRYLSYERGTGSRLGVQEDADIRVEGPIPRVIQAASDEVERLIYRRRALSGAGRFESQPIVPRDAWLEGLVNAVIHRSYSLGGDHIRVELFPNRVEIESPGRFPGLADPTTPLEISRFARNPRIARVCADLRIGQELGEGIRRIFEEMRRVGLSDPVYRQTAGSVRLSLTAAQRLDPRIARRLPAGSQRVLDALRGAQRPLGTGDLAAELHLSRPATLTRLKALQREELILWVGKSQRDPRAVWMLNE